MTLYDSKSLGEDDPMVSGPVNHCEIRVGIKASRSGVSGVVKGLIGSGCFCLLISQATLQRLGLPAIYPLFCHNCLANH